MSTQPDPVASWRKTLRDHASHGRCAEWVHAYTSLIQAGEPIPTVNSRPQGAAGEPKETQCSSVS